MSGCGLFFRELLGEALPRAVETDRGGVLRAVEGDCELRVRQAFPGGEAEDLLFLRAQLAERGDDFSEIAAFGLRRLGKLAQPQTKREQAPRRAALVREHARRDRVEPRELQLLRRS